MIIHKSAYVEISYDEEKSIIIDKFLSATNKMTTDEFKQEMFIFVDICKKNLPTRELVNLIEMQYTIVPDVQDWMNIEIFPHYENIIKRMAFLLPPDIITQMSIEQTMEEEVGKKFVQKYFDNEDVAINWLLEK